MVAKVRLGELLISKGLITKRELEEALEEQKKKGGFLGQILIGKNIVSSTDIARAMGELTTRVEEDEKLGRTLVANKIITEEQFKIVQDKQRLTRQRLAKTVVTLGFARPEAIAKEVGEFWGIPYISLANHKPTPETMELLPEDFMRRNHLIPVKLEGDTILVAMSDPLNIMAIDEMRLLTTHEIHIMIATERDISLVLNNYFNMQRIAKEALSGMVTGGIEEGPIIKLVDTIIDGGINAKASDIHLEPQDPEMRVRYRIDGILHDIMNVPKTIDEAVVSRIKVLADMDISEKRRPQDGHIVLTKEGKQYDLRIASFATVGGEKIVMRILDKTSMILGLNELGLSGKDEKTFQSFIQKPYGIILVTGPTGSGKTTTLYAVLSRLNTLTKNIITVENPVEYKLEGINQSQINPQAGITFATGLKSILRQDPDIIMVGEIRDLETAQIAIQAALTGHLVFSTLHTNDAPSAATRLIDMGVAPFLISSSVIGVLAQRLVRVVCSDCKEKYSPDSNIFDDLEMKKDAKYNFVRGKGCQYCFGTGYRGRTGVFEVMRVSDNIKQLITKKVPATVIKDQAIKEGMNTLKQSSIEKVLEGITTLEEVKRVIFAEGE